MRATDITLEVFEKYKPEELADVAKQMAQAQGDLETVEVEKKLSDGAFNERIKQHGSTVSDLAKKYNKGGESAQIGCTIRYDIPEVGKKSYIRMDTEETVEVHDMDFSERQETIQFPLPADGMSYFVHCDRCHQKHQIFIYGLPSGWERVCGADLCDMCSQLLHKFLQPQPILTTAERADAEKNA